MESKKERNKKWFEVFSGGDVWELMEIDGKLIGFRTHNDASDYSEDELAHNGISDFEERARVMHLIPTEIHNEDDFAIYEVAMETQTQNEQHEPVYKMVVDSNVDMSGKIDEGTLHEIIESTGFCFYEIDDPERPYLVYRDRDELDRDPDGRHAIGYLQPTEEEAESEK